MARCFTQSWGTQSQCYLSFAYYPLVLTDFLHQCSGDHPEVIGEASLLLAQTCFSGIQKIDGGNGHDQLDVTCKSLAYSPNAPT
jgi:hypothetical protein